MAFLPRHGRGHVMSPTTVPYRANIDALKRLGVTDVISVSRLRVVPRRKWRLGDFVIVDQFIDRTFARDKSFFGTGCVAHVSVAHPTCPRLPMRLRRCGSGCGHRRFTAAERIWRWRARNSRRWQKAKMYREAGAADVIGMTNMPEAKLAREAELCYASVAMITDYDSWHPDHGEVDVTKIIKTLMGNADKGRSMPSAIKPSGRCAVTTLVGLAARQGGALGELINSAPKTGLSRCLQQVTTQGVFGHAAAVTALNLNPSPFSSPLCRNSSTHRARSGPRRAFSWRLLSGWRRSMRWPMLWRRTVFCGG